MFAALALLLAADTASGTEQNSYSLADMQNQVTDPPTPIQYSLRVAAPYVPPTPKWVATGLRWG